MTSKTEIIERLSEKVVLLPSLNALNSVAGATCERLVVLRALSNPARNRVTVAD